VAPRAEAVGDREQGRVLAGVVGARRRGIAAVIGGQDEHIVPPEQAQPAGERRVDLTQRVVEALDIVPVSIDLVGLDQVGEDEAARQRLEQVRRLRDRASVRGARMLDVNADAREQLADLADRVDLDRIGL
jgi:hypothetical protein